MSYDGIIMQRAIARFDQARQRREAELDQRRREVFARQPRLRDIDRTLRTTMSRIVAAAAKKTTWRTSPPVPSAATPATPGPASAPA